MSRKKTAAKLKAFVSRIPRAIRESYDAEQIIERQLREYGRHLVALTALREPLHEQSVDRRADFLFASGFIITIRRSWWWVTAGHIIDRIEGNDPEDKSKYSKFRLVDHFGTGNDRSRYIPFVYEDAQKIYEYDPNTGVDYGLVKLPPLVVAALKANKVVSVPKKEWNRKNQLPFDFHFMMGIPQDSYEYSTQNVRGGYVVRANAKPSVMYIDKTEKAPRNSIRPKYPRFVGKVGSRFNVAGMSGGPIFGIVLDTLEQGIVAVQNGWLPTSRITFGFPVAQLACLAECRLKTKQFQ